MTTPGHFRIPDHRTQVQTLSLRVPINQRRTGDENICVPLSELVRPEKKEEVVSSH